jgi:hypothetical protein
MAVANSSQSRFKKNGGMFIRFAELGAGRSKNGLEQDAPAT